MIWKKDFVKKSITIYYQNDADNRLNFYKAEIILDNTAAEQFYQNLLNFEKYLEIFSKIIVCKKVDVKDEKMYYYVLNFHPLKNRDYYVNLNYYTDKNDTTKKYVIEWFPILVNKNLPEINNGFVHAKNIYDRWLVIENRGKVTISVEYYNDFKVIDPKAIVHAIEKDITMDAVRETS